MNTPPNREETLFHAALQLQSEKARAAFLKEACEGDEALRQRVAGLLEAHLKAGGFLEQPPTEIAQPGVATPASSEPIRFGPQGTRILPATEKPGDSIGRYKLMEQIGEGGFGVVYVAEQREPVKRRVALKVIKLGMDTKDVVARFEAERQALAMMDHPNIAKVLDGGATDTGRPYFVMELVRGIPITKYCDENNLSIGQRLELFKEVCDAIQHAHQKGIIHRDIKPSNILVTVNAGVPVPKVIDFGIAKATQGVLTDKTIYTQFEQFIGTPAYASPEQAEMSSLDIDTRSDIYSLGVLLYELLTGKLPFDYETLMKAGLDEMRRIIREVEPPKPSTRLSTLAAADQSTVAQRRQSSPVKLSNLLRGDLDWIVMKALEKDRMRRYDTANSFAQDIQRYLGNEAVLACPPSMTYVLGKLIRRHRLVASAGAAVFIALVASVTVATWQAVRATHADERTRRMLYASHINLAKQAWDEARVDRVVELLELYRPQPGKPDLRNFEWFYLDRLCHSDLLTLKGHSRIVESVVFSPDGKRLASASQDQTVKVWDATTGRELFRVKWHTGPVRSVASSPDGKQVASASDDKTVKVWDATNGQEKFTFKGHTAAVNSVAFSPDGKRLASASTDGTVKVWDATNGQEKLTFKGHKLMVSSVAFSPDGKRLASASVDQTVKVWDATTGQEALTLKGHTAHITSVAFSPDAKRLASASQDQTVKLWDVSSGQETFTFKGHTGPVSSVAFSQDGKRLASASWDGTVKVWDGNETITLKGHSGYVSSVAFSPDGKRLASGGGRDGNETVIVWDATRGQEPLKLNGLAKTVAFSPDGKRLASASRALTLEVWDATSGEETLTLKGHTGLVENVAFSQDGKQVASASDDKTVKVWDATNGQEKFTFKGHTAAVNSVAFSPDGKRLASASGGSVKVWDAMNGEVLLTLKENSGAVLSVAFSPDGKRLASASYQEVMVWDATPRSQENQ